MKRSLFNLIIFCSIILTNNKSILAQTGPNPTPITQWTGTGFEIRNPSGSVLMGPLNNGWCHMYTDRPNFIFNKGVHTMGGMFSSYYQDNLYLQTGGTTRMTIQNSTGNIGIGKTPSAYKLDVAGDINFTGNLLKNGQPFSSGSSVWAKDAANNISYSGGNVSIQNGNLKIFGASGNYIAFYPDYTLGFENDPNPVISVPSCKTLTFYNPEYYGNCGGYFLNIQAGSFSVRDKLTGDQGGIYPSAIVLSKANSTHANVYIANDGNAHFNGKITSNEVEIKQDIWSDDVFNHDYKLMALPELEKFINAHQHLPGVPTEVEVKKDGVNIAEMNALFLKKIEELTKYVIEQEKRQTETTQKLEALQKENEQIKKELGQNKTGRK